MIEYEPDSSSFFTANKEYCEMIVHKLMGCNIEYTGSCNSFGYDVVITFKRNNHSYTFKFHKHQSTQNGIVIPVDAINYAGTSLLINGMERDKFIEIEKSLLKRFLFFNKFKKMLPSPYYVRSNYPSGNGWMGSLAVLVKANNISKFKLDKGTLKCKMHSAIEEPLGLISSIEEIIG